MKKPREPAEHMGNGGVGGSVYEERKAGSEVGARKALEVNCSGDGVFGCVEVGPDSNDQRCRQVQTEAWHKHAQHAAGQAHASSWQPAPGGVPPHTCPSSTSADQPTHQLTLHNLHQDGSKHAHHAILYQHLNCTQGRHDTRRGTA